MEPALFEEKLSAACVRALKADGKISELQRLSGGASMESWAFVFGGEEFVLRRLPSGISADDEGLRGIPLSTQADVIEQAAKQGVTAPVVRGRLTPEDGIGEGFFMERARGETLPHKILGNPEFAKAEKALSSQCAAELAAIHNMDPATLPENLEYFTPVQLIQLQKDKYHEIGGAIPIYEFAFHWLFENAPKTDVRKPVHGDFRMGNLMITPDGISAVLDWELARFGDPVQDLAYLCTPSWRFGRYDQIAGGFDSKDNFLAAYARHSGEEVDNDRFRFWLIYSTLWWGVACMVMGEIWRSGGDRSLERTVIGRRVSEVEIDLALLFEELLPPEICTKLDWQTSGPESVKGETAYGELLTALQDWNSEHVLPGLKGHNKFQSRVAGNALGILQRQEDWGRLFADAQQRRLAAIGYDHGQVCRALSEGVLDIATPGLWDHLRLSALERLSIDQPRYAGLQTALKKWSSQNEF
ncbi:Predicted kinase, aminoglycoside phosphotransferase (APT) family [Parasphingorhabdus marina DSM 22363]|uniref:Predicted kinase, aminoglycoside phosphotransferase (APT) family n=1 Tax=Parasphingorhabdus marina DSM 22363 TaxID=1123272 RepID=A0A1N6FD10_9SPHN|nr:phosphotransferase family protein [Parasphingorhabdus marina]SIN93158.1 Predicted kinase, aminoglycoside phosphotransferase (APT) family [Parasphingorhabdus marina DSM 22363]